MKKFLIKLLISTLAIMLTAWLLPGIHIDTFTTALCVALVLALLNILVKPLIVLVTLPVTLLTLGLFLLFINAFIIKLAGNLVDGFYVAGYLHALLFSIALSVITYIMERLGSNPKQRP